MFYPIAVSRWEPVREACQRATRREEPDLQAILTIRKYYGVTSDNQAIILAVNLIARQIEEGRASSPAPDKERRLPPPALLGRGLRRRFW